MFKFVNITLQEVDVRGIQRLQVIKMNVASNGREFLFAVVVVDQQVGSKTESLFVFVADNQRFRA